MARSDYGELLRDPRWQRLRLEVMQRDGFICQWCFAVDKTLNVHHTFYRKGAAPWEYDAGTLITLCETCHRGSGEALRREGAEVLGRALVADRQIFNQILAYARVKTALVLANEAPIATTGPHDIDGIAEAIGVSPGFVAERVEPSGVVNPVALQLQAERTWSGQADEAMEDILP